MYVRETLPLIVENYVATGKVVYIFRNFPLPFHEQARIAAEAVECATLQEQFWPMHDLVFEKQQEWSGNANALTIFLGYAAELGLDEAAFESCMSEHQTIAFIENDYAYAAQIGVEATPSFLVHKWGLRGAQPYDVFQQAIEMALEETGP